MSEPTNIPRGSKQRPRKEYPYFKVQVWEDRLAAYQDLPKAHQVVEEAKRFIAVNCHGQKTRIMIVEGDRSRRVFE